MQMLFVSGSYQNYKNVAVSNQLAALKRGGVFCDSEAVDVFERGCSVLI
jgi:hypothetical protein